MTPDERAVLESRLTQEVLLEAIPSAVPRYHRILETLYQELSKP